MVLFHTNSRAPWLLMKLVLERATPWPHCFLQIPGYHICLFQKPHCNFREHVWTALFQYDTLSRKSLARVVQAAEIHQMVTVADGSFCGNLVTYGLHSRCWGLLVTRGWIAAKVPAFLASELCCPDQSLKHPVQQATPPQRSRATHKLCCLLPILPFLIISHLLFATCLCNAQGSMVTSN